MNTRSVQIHALILAVVLAAAWFITHAEEKPADNKTDKGPVLVQSAEGDTESIVWSTDDKTLRIEARKDDLGRWFYGIETKSTETPADTEGGEPSVEETTEVFRAGGVAETLWGMLEPFRAVRVLDNLDDAKREELGLNETTGSLKMVVRGKEHSFQLGGKAYGTSDQYALTDDGRAVVLPASVTRDLSQGMRRFRERRLLSENRTDIDKILFTEGERSMEIEQHNASEGSKAFWARAGEEKEGKAEFKVVVDKLFGVQAKSYFDEAMDAGEAVLSVTIKSAGVDKDTIEIFSVTEGDKRVFRARSGHSRLLAEVDDKRVEEMLEALTPLW